MPRNKLTHRKKKRILVVDDHPDTADVLKQGLNQHGFEVEAYVDPRSALLNFKANAYDLLLLDVIMKGLDGIQFYHEMRKIDQKIRVCFISASDTFYEKYKNHFPEIEKEYFIEKPITIKELANTIGSIIRN